MSEVPATGSPPPASSIQRDVSSAYLATAARIASWVVVLGLIYRYDGVAEFALFSLVRGTIGILNYTALGLSPAMVRLLAEARNGNGNGNGGDEGRDRLLTQSVYTNGLVVALITGALGTAVTLVYAALFNRIYTVPTVLHVPAIAVVLAVGIGTTLRLMSDAPGSALQAYGRIRRDNVFITAGEVAWVVATLLLAPRFEMLSAAAGGYLVSGVALLLLRCGEAGTLTGVRALPFRLVDRHTLKRLLAFSSLVLFAQLADYLYAPTDYILINLLLGWEQVAIYTPAVTIDGGLLLLVTGLSSVILPRAAIAHTRGEIERVRRYYIWGTVFSTFLLVFGGVVVWIASPLIFRLWLGEPMRATQAILPLVLVHTVVGGSSAVGRSILLGMGRVRPFTIAVLTAGTMNVVLSYIFVRHLNLGLKGVVLGTIVVVVSRAGIWMPWYVLRTLRREAQVKTNLTQ